MNRAELLDPIRNGEDSTVEFERDDVRNGILPAMRA